MKKNPIYNVLFMFLLLQFLLIQNLSAAQLSIPTILFPSNSTGSTSAPTVTVTGNVSVNWTGTGISGTRYYYKAIEDGTTNIIVPESNTTGTSFSIPSSILAHGKIYKIWVCARLNGYTEANYIGYFKASIQLPTPTISSPAISTASTSTPTVSVTSNVIVKWNGTGISGTTYHYKAIEEGTTNVIVPESNTTGTSFSIPSSSLKSGKIYKIWVCARLSGYAEANYIGYFKAVIPALPTPSILNPVNSTVSTSAPTVSVTGNVTVNWSSTGISGTTYNYKVIEEGTTNVIVPESYTAGTSFSIPHSSLANGKIYKIWVCARLSGYTEANYVGYFKAVIPALPTPSILNPVNSTVSTSAPTVSVTGNVTVNWSSTGISGTTYNYKVIEEGTTNVIVPESYTAGTSFSIPHSSLANGKIYKIWVCARLSGYTEANYIGYFKAVFPALTTPTISSPVNNTVNTSAPTVSVTGNVSVSWNGTGISGTTYYYKVIEEGTTNVIVPESYTAGTSFSIPHSSLANGKIYKIWVCARLSGYTEANYIGYFKAVFPALTAPTISSPVNNTVNTSAPTVSVTGNVGVSWNGTGISGTTYYYKVIEEGTTNVIVPESYTTGTSLSIPSSSLANGKIYKIWVCARLSGYTEANYIGYFKAVFPALTAPTISSPVNSTVNTSAPTVSVTGNVSVSWNGTGISGTIYYHKVIEEGTTNVIVPESYTTGTSLSIPSSSLANGKIYKIWVCARLSGYTEANYIGYFKVATQLPVPSIRVNSPLPNASVEINKTFTISATGTNCHHIAARIIDDLTGQSVKDLPVITGNTYSSSYTPIDVKNIRVRFYYINTPDISYPGSKKDSIDVAVIVSAPPTQPSIELVNVTSNSITVKVKYPTEGYGNRLNIHNQNLNTWTFQQPDARLTSGTYVFSNLPAGNSFGVSMDWLDGQWQSKTIFTPTAVSGDLFYLTQLVQLYRGTYTWNAEKMICSVSVNKTVKKYNLSQDVDNRSSDLQIINNKLVTTKAKFIQEFFTILPGEVFLTDIAGATNIIWNEIEQTATVKINGITKTYNINDCKIVNDKIVVNQSDFEYQFDLGLSAGEAYLRKSAEQKGAAIQYDSKTNITTVSYGGRSRKYEIGSQYVKMVNDRIVVPCDDLDFLITQHEPSIEVIENSLTSSSVTVRIIYPFDGAYGNRLTILDHKKGWRFYQPDCYMNHGVYTLTGLTPGGNVSINIDWHDGVNWKSKTIIVTMQHNDPILIARKIGDNTISVTVRYPYSGNRGNRLQLFEAESGVFLKDIVPSVNLEDSTYLVDRLTPGKKFEVRMLWYENGVEKFKKLTIIPGELVKRYHRYTGELKEIYKSEIAVFPDYVDAEFKCTMYSAYDGSSIVFPAKYVKSARKTNWLSETDRITVYSPNGSTTDAAPVNLRSLIRGYTAYPGTFVIVMHKQDNFITVKADKIPQKIAEGYNYVNIQYHEFVIKPYVYSEVVELAQNYFYILNLVRETDLFDLGQFENDGIDGKWSVGGYTFKAIQKFQGEHSLLKTGKLDPLTFAILQYYAEKTRFGLTRSGIVSLKGIVHEKNSVITDVPVAEKIFYTDILDAASQGRIDAMRLLDEAVKRSHLNFRVGFLTWGHEVESALENMDRDVVYGTAGNILFSKLIDRIALPARIASKVPAADLLTEFVVEKTADDLVSDGVDFALGLADLDEHGLLKKIAVPLSKAAFINRSEYKYLLYQGSMIKAFWHDDSLKFKTELNRLLASVDGRKMYKELVLNNTYQGAMEGFFQRVVEIQKDHQSWLNSTVYIRSVMKGIEDKIDSYDEETLQKIGTNENILIGERCVKILETIESIDDFKSNVEDLQKLGQIYNSIP